MSLWKRDGSETPLYREKERIVLTLLVLYNTAAAVGIRRRKLQAEPADPRRNEKVIDLGERERDR